MLFHATKKETLTTGIGALLLTALAGILSQPISEAPAVLQTVRQSIALLSLESIGALVLLFGLSVGFWRHRNPSPLLFALLGIGGLFLLQWGGLPIYLPMLCGVCFVVAGVWDLLLKNPNTAAEKDAPRLDDFLDTTLAPSTNDADAEE